MQFTEAVGGLVAQAAEAAVEAEGRGVERHQRYLNKAFGQHRCPFLTHLAAGRPYLAMGPNDPLSRIHESDESLPLDTLGVHMRPFNALLTQAASQ